MTKEWNELDATAKSWLAAVCIGIVCAAFMIGLGYTPTAGVTAALFIAIFFGVFLDWAFGGNDLQTQLDKTIAKMKPAKMLSNKDVAMGDPIFDIKAVKLDGLVDMLKPKSMIKNEDLMKAVGIRGELSLESLGFIPSKPAAKTEAPAAKPAPKKADTK